MLGREPDADGDERQEQHLPPSPQTEGATMREFDEVVQKTDRAAAERHEEDGEGGNLVLRDGEECDRRDHEDQQTSHRRRALLDPMSLRSFLANVLPELVPAQERDELRTDDDRHDHRDHACGEDADHAVGTWVKVAAIVSRPMAREAFTSTASPGRTTSPSSRSASWTLATHRPGTPASR